MKVKYVGAHDVVVLPLPDGRELTAIRDGSPIEVPDQVGASLLLQTVNWERVMPEKADKTAAKKEEE